MRLREHDPWPRERIEKQLRAFFAEREAWPNFLAFADAGYGRLHAQAMAWGGPYHWGRKLGVEVPGRTVIWNQALVRAGLVPFLEGRTKWPGVREFEEVGLTSLYWATDQHGGKTHWAEEFGLEYRSRAKERVERELVEFLGERRTLPTKDEFDAAGRRDLCSAMRSYGGMIYWCRRLGLTVMAGPLDRGRE